MQEIISVKYKNIKKPAIINLNGNISIYFTTYILPRQMALIDAFAQTSAAPNARIA